MTEDEIRRRAQRFRQLMDDETYQELRALVTDMQGAVFFDPRSTPDAREEAHAILRAQDAMDRQLRKAVGDATILDHKAARDQHRGSHD